MKSIKLIAFLLIISLLLTIISGCTQPPDDTTPTDATSGQYGGEGDDQTPTPQGDLPPVDDGMQDNTPGTDDSSVENVADDLDDLTTDLDSILEDMG